MLLLVTARPGFTPPWPSYAHVTTIQLTRLSRDEGAALVGRVTLGKNLPAEVMDQILAPNRVVDFFARGDRFDRIEEREPVLLLAPARLLLCRR